MNPVLELLLGYGFGGVIAGLVIWLFAKSYFPAYFSEKGKNLAQKEDIEKLTRIVEQVKTEQVLLVERFKSVNQLRLAAIDKRLAAHQEAYTHWVEMFSAVFDTGRRHAVVMAAWQWWNANNLYLEPAARDAFRQAMSATVNHHLLVNVDYGQGSGVDAIRDNFKRIADAGEEITRAVALPGLTEPERAELAQKLEALP